MSRLEHNFEEAEAFLLEARPAQAFDAVLDELTTETARESPTEGNCIRSFDRPLHEQTAGVPAVSCFTAEPTWRAAYLRLSCEMSRTAPRSAEVANAA